MDVRPSSKRVPPAEGRSVVLRAGDGYAGTHGVAGAQQRPEVRLVGHPQRGDDQVVLAAVLAPAATVEQVRSPVLLARRHRREDELLVMLIGDALGGGVGPSTRPLGATGRTSVRRDGDAGVQPEESVVRTRSTPTTRRKNADLATAMAGKVWLADRAGALLDETPTAYKDIDQVMADQADLVTVLHTLHQVLNYKGT
jgi:hypothetical protein